MTNNTSTLTFTDTQTSGRVATFHAVLAQRDDLDAQVRLDVRVEHSKRGYYTVSVRRRVYSTRTGTTSVAPSALRSMPGHGTADSGRFSPKGLAVAAQHARDDLLARATAGDPYLGAALGGEFSEHDVQCALMLSHR